MTMSIAELILRMERAWDVQAPDNIARGETQRTLPDVHDGGDQPLSDELVARNVADVLTDQVIWIPQTQSWYMWNGAMWEEDSENAVAFLIREVMRRRPECSLWYVTKGPNPQLARSVPSLALAESVAKGLKSDPRIVVSVTRFDQDAYTLNTPGGLIDLTTGEVVESERPSLVRLSTSVAPVAGPTPLWDYVLESAFPGDTGTQRYMESVLSLALFGNQDVQQFWMLSGEAGSGKGTILNTVQSILGTGASGYAMPVEMEFLMTGNSGGHPEKYARLFGKRMVVASEADEHGATFSAARVKNLTGGDIITGRYLNKNSFSFEPSWKMFLMTNYRPSVSFEDEGFWRRFREVPFRHKPTEVVISNLRARLVAEEGPAILARLIERARDYMRDGVETPEAVRLATLDNRGEQDHVEAFIQDACSVADAERTEKSVFYDSFVAWCKRERIEPLTQRQVVKRLRELDHEVKKSNNTTFVYGIKVTNPVVTY